MVERLIGRLLDPIDALTAAIYSIFVVLTLTLSFTVIKRGADYHEPIPEGFGIELFLTVLGATIAWGLIDGLMLALLSMLERGEQHRFLHKLQAAAADSEALEVIADEFDFLLEPIASGSKRQDLYADMLEHLRDSEPRPVGFQRVDLIEMIGATLVAIVVALPSLAPLWFLRDAPLLALRASNAVSFVMLFVLGYRWGVHTGAGRLKTGLQLALAGAIIMAIAIPLGG